MNLGDKEGKYQPEPHPAIITGVYPPVGSPEDDGKSHIMSADLVIFYKTGQFWMERVPFWTEARPGYWYWPRIEE